MWRLVQLASCTPTLFAHITQSRVMQLYCYILVLNACDPVVCSEGHPFKWKIDYCCL